MSPQRDRDGTVLAVLPPTWGGVTASGYEPVVTQAAERGFAECAVLDRARIHARNRGSLSPARSITRDLVHRFFEHQMQIDGGKNDGYAAWSDAGGLAMGYWDYQRLGALCARPRVCPRRSLLSGRLRRIFPQSSVSDLRVRSGVSVRGHRAAHPSIAILEKDASGHYLPRLKLAPESPAIGPRRAAAVRAERQHHARELFRRRQILCRQHHAAALSAERQSAGAADAKRPVRRSLEGDHAAAAERRHHRRSAGRQAHILGLVCGLPGMRRSPTAASRRAR